MHDLKKKNDFYVVTEGTQLRGRWKRSYNFHFQAFNLRQEHKVHDSLKSHEMHQPHPIIHRE